MPFRRFALRPSGIAALLAVLLSAAGCGGSVQGKLLHTPETFTGTSNVSIDGNGTLKLVSNKGVKCRGPYRQEPADASAEIRVVEHRESGRATLTCDDGRTGTVLFMVGADQAVGTGMLGEDIVTLTIVQ